MAWLGNARFPAMRRQRASNAEFVLFFEELGSLLVSYRTLAAAGSVFFCRFVHNKGTTHYLPAARHTTQVLQSYIFKRKQLRPVLRQLQQHCARGWRRPHISTKRNRPSPSTARSA